MERQMSPDETMLPSNNTTTTTAAEPADHLVGPSASTSKIPDRSEDVMLTLSVSPDPPVPPRNHHNHNHDNNKNNNNNNNNNNKRPFLRSHVRSRSLAEIPGAPMTRAHSSPGLDSRGRYIFVNNHGLGDSSAHRYVPLQVMAAHDNIQAKMASLDVSENTKLDPAASTRSSGSSSSPVLAPHAFSRMNRRRPSSPLHFHVTTTTNGSNQHPGSGSPSSSPLVINTKYNESYPGYSSSSTSSLPSTPSSLRSRSPSISSLETIPDIPDAEAAATEADRVAALKAATEKTDAGEINDTTNRRRGMSEASNPSGVSTAPLRTGSGAYGLRTDRRKRWSVCGAERRQDLDLETIWED